MDTLQTPLMVASSHGSMGAVRLLLSLKASPNLVDRAGASAVDAALKHAHTDVAKELRDAGGALGWDEGNVAAELCEASRAGAAAPPKRRDALRVPSLLSLFSCGSGGDEEADPSRTMLASLHFSASHAHPSGCR